MEFKRLVKKFLRNKGAVVCLVIALAIIFITVFSDLIAPYGFDDQNLVNQLKPPSGEHLFGTDELGRDVFSRVLIGGKTSITIGFVAVIMMVLIGVPLGLVAGYFPKADLVIMRIVDIFMALPGTLLAIAIVAALGPSVGNVTIAVAIFSIPTLTRVVRANVLSAKENEYVLAAVTYGVPHYKIIFKHILPNIIHSVIVLATIRFATSVLTSAGLSFLGLGVQAPMADWGSLINAGRKYVRSAWWLVACPGLTLVLFSVTINVLGDALRDVLDPKI